MVFWRVSPPNIRKSSTIKCVALVQMSGGEDVVNNHSEYSGNTTALGLGCYLAEDESGIYVGQTLALIIMLMPGLVLLQLKMGWIRT